MSYSRSVLPPNDWVEYVDAHTGEVLHIDAFHNPHRAMAPPGIPPQCFEAEPQ